MADITVPHGLAAAVLVTLTKRDGRWVDEDELVDLVRCQYSEALDAFPNEGGGRDARPRDDLTVWKRSRRAELYDSRAHRLLASGQIGQ